MKMSLLSLISTHSGPQRHCFPLLQRTGTARNIINRQLRLLLSLLSFDRNQKTDAIFLIKFPLLQADTFWIAKYVPFVKANLQKLKKAVGDFNSICQKKIDARKNSVNKNEDFIGIYLRELEANESMEDRQDTVCAVISGRCTLTAQFKVLQP